MKATSKIVRILNEKGITQLEIAQTVGVTPSVVNQVLHGTKSSEKVADEIERITGIRPARVYRERKRR